MPTATQTPPDLDQLEDSALLKRYVDQRCERSFALLFDRWHAKLVRFTASKIGDWDTAEEIVQQAWTQAFRHAHRFDWEKKFSTWIYTITANLAKNQLRNRSRSPVTLFRTLRARWEQDEDSRPLQWSDFSFAPDRGYQRRQLKSHVEEAVGELKPQHRIVFLLREMEGKSYEEISEVTGSALGTIKSRLSRARTHFAEAIRDRLAKADLDQLEVPDVAPTPTVDLNTADAEELKTLPEIGVVKAQEIIENRPLASLDEVGQLAGFSTAILKAIGPLVTLSDEPEAVAA